MPMSRLFTFLLVLISYSGLSQEWAPMGATWHYTELEAFAPTVDFFKIKVTGTQLIHGKLCKRLTTNDIPIGNPISSTNNFTYEENDTVYWYSPDLDSLMIMYDFNAGVGDSWDLLLLDHNNLPDLDTLRVSVDSVDTFNYNGTVLKRMHVRYDFIGEIYSWWYFSSIIESVGDVYYLFNFPGLDGVFYDGNYPDGIRCYSDTVQSDFRSSNSTPLCQRCTRTQPTMWFLSNPNRLLSVMMFTITPAD